MAITQTVIYQGQNLLIADIVSSADGDTTASLPHGLSGTPSSWVLTPTIGAAAAFAALPQWNISATSATTYTVNKVGTAGTAVNSNARVVISRPHSIIG